MAFRRLWHTIEAPHTHSSATQLDRRPSARASTKFLRGVGWLPPRHDGARPPVPTTRALSVLGVCGWGLAPCTAHPCVGSAFDSFTCVLCFAVSGRAPGPCGALDCTPLEQPSCAPGVGAGRPHGLYPPPTDPRMRVEARGGGVLCCRSTVRALSPQTSCAICPNLDCVPGPCYRRRRTPSHRKTTVARR